MGSERPAPLDLRAPEIRITLPAAPESVGPCLARSFPDIPDRALNRVDLMRIIGEAKLQDRMKAACGARAVAWIEKVRAAYAR
uniref:hypothetical protein n=1 Tax=Methylobacterium sp. CCH5-D2 TaxID=1768765 RepID=UPI000B063D2A|nr:hypothetical protein [Methylobacterium sp. CCH5-D2]